MAVSTGHAAAQILEDQAEGRVKSIFEDIKSAYRVPFVALLYTVLATEPDVLDLAWRQLHPNVQTVHFERQAADIRRVAAAGVATAGIAVPPPEQDAARVVAAIHYAGPKFLLSAAALRAAVRGQVPKLENLPNE